MFGPEDYEADMIQIQQEIPEADEQEAEVPAQSERFGDFIVRYLHNVPGTQGLLPGASFEVINEIFGVFYIPMAEVGQLEINSYSYNSIPQCYTYMDTESLNASGIIRLHNHPYLQLCGRGTAVAIIDSGKHVIILPS
ncbi:hypothetical protein NXH76_26340 [Blautia schinkii]|nr:hypothetical protein [Blautia schinkii]